MYVVFLQINICVLTISSFYLYIYDWFITKLQDYCNCILEHDYICLTGKLHRHIVQLQVSEGTAVRRLEECQKKVNKLEALVLRLEQKLDDKDQTVYHNKSEAQGKINHLKRNLQVIQDKNTSNTLGKINPLKRNLQVIEG